MKIKISPLRIPLKTSFKQASSVRNTSESTWVAISRGDYNGYGEGCPRPYVTNENIDSCLKWLSPRIDFIEKEVTDLESLEAYIVAEKAGIDKNPAAWCGLEMALLDLFAQEKKCSVEKLLGLKNPQAVYQYTAVLGDSAPDKFEKLIERYLKWGFTDFKVKVNGELKLDQLKLKTLVAFCKKVGIENFRIRLDANNLWSGQAQAAVDYLAQLNVPLLGIEEPVEPKNPQALSEISTALNTPVILDESLCNLNDLEAYDPLEGQFIANIKVSRVGGVLRSLQLIEALKKRNWPIIIGAHVGETSVLTRAGMLAAQAAGKQLIAQEGCFGEILLEKDVVAPSLQFGARGRLDLTSAYTVKSETGNKIYPTNIWEYGWGLKPVKG